MILKKTKLGLTFDILEDYKIFMNIYKLALFIPFLFIMACSASYEEIREINIGKPKTFQEHVFFNYQQKANFEAEEMHDWNSAKLYSEKALRAQRGENIYPEQISYWKLPLDKVKLAIKRDHSLPIKFNGTEIEKKEFEKIMKNSGLTIQTGGRIMNVCDNVNKSIAMSKALQLI